MSFTLLKEANICSKLAAKYKVQLDALAVEFDRRFQDFKNLEQQFNILGCPFTTEVDLAPEDIQLELLDLQANNDLKEKFKSVSLHAFCKSFSDNLFPNLKNFAAKFLTLFGSTHICEKAFSCLMINKSKNRSLLTDANLHALMRISTRKRAPNFKKIVKNYEQLHKSH